MWRNQCPDRASSGSSQPPPALARPGPRSPLPGGVTFQSPERDIQCPINVLPLAEGYALPSASHWTLRPKCPHLSLSNRSGKQPCLQKAEPPAQLLTHPVELGLVTPMSVKSAAFAGRNPKEIGKLLLSLFPLSSHVCCYFLTLFFSLLREALSSSPELACSEGMGCTTAIISGTDGVRSRKSVNSNRNATC